MALRRTAPQTPDAPAPAAHECPECAFFAGAEEQYSADEYPTIRRNLAKARAQHVDDGECVALEAVHGQR